MTFSSYFDQHQDEILKEYFTYLRFKTVSSEAGNEEEMEKCIDWLQSYLEPIGFKVQIWKTHSHPVLFAESPKVADAPTLLIYNHYDVQPVDPIELWDSPPFEPTLRNGKIYARGANDDKGQSLYVLAALKAYKELHGKFPLNIKLIIEGDEETGSSGLDQIIPQKKAELKSDYLTIVDLGILSKEKPSICFGIRGIVTMDVEIEGPCHDMHSGFEGGVVLNPIHALCDLLASLRDEDGKIVIKDFYEGIKPLSEEEKKKIYTDFDEKSYIRDHGVPPRGGEKEFSPYERAWIRPTLEVNGIYGGYTGQGFKTVIPSKAFAKVSCRLVDGQDPETVGLLVKNYLEENAPKATKVRVNLHRGMGRPVKSKFNSPLTQAIIKSYEEVLGKEVVFTFEGGSIPISSELALASQADIAFIGLGLPTDLIHAPNEHFDIDRIKQGFCIIGQMINHLGANR